MWFLMKSKDMKNDNLNYDLIILECLFIYTHIF